MPVLERLLDRGEDLICRAGLKSAATWDRAVARTPVRLYAGRLSRGLPQYHTHFGITPYFRSSRNISHDVTSPYPISSETVDVYQSEDVFEHVPLDAVVPILDEIYRILKPGGLLRLSVPDYHCDLYRSRTQRDRDGELLFDPGGGGALRDGQVVDGGHLWFPTVEIVRGLFAKSKFADAGRIDFLQFNEADGTTVTRPVDYSLGHVQRTPDHDARVTSPRRALSIIVDAWKSPSAPLEQC